MGISCYSNGSYKEGIYQDLWIKGSPARFGGRNCQDRYDAIEKYVETLPGPLKVLDLGANMGYFSFRLAERFFGHFVMIESCPSTTKRLFQLCLINGNPQIFFLAARVNLEQLKKLLEKEKFDLIIALSVIHHFDEHFNEIVKTFAQNAKYVILEHANPEETHCPNPVRIRAEPVDLSPYNAQKLISTPATGYRHIMRDVYALRGHIPEDREAPEGLSLQTFAEYNGIFPHPEKIQKEIKKVKNKETLRLVKGKVTYPK